MKHLLVASTAYAFFVVCPRMAAMAHIIAGTGRFDLMSVSVIGTLLALPLIMLMTAVFRWWGMPAALALAVMTDLLAALVMGGISGKAALETGIIAVFVIAGVKAASFFSAGLP